MEMSTMMMSITITTMMLLIASSTTALDSSNIPSTDQYNVPSSSLPTCAQTLEPCSKYTSSAAPPQECCNPLKQVIDSPSQKTCLCNLLTEGNSVAKLAGIDIAKIVLLSEACKITKDSSTVCPDLTKGAAGALTWSVLAGAAAVLAPLVF